MNAQTGNIVNLYVAPVAFLDADASEGVRVEDQINLTLRAAADQQEYQHNLPAKGAVTLKTLEEWQAQGKLVTVLSSGLRAIAFIHDNRKDESGNPLRKYQRSGRKVNVGENLAVEADAFVVFQSYDVQLADTVGMGKLAENARGDYIRRQQEFRKRANQARVEKAHQMVEERKAQAKAKVAQATAGGAGGAGKKTA